VSYCVVYGDELSLHMFNAPRDVFLRNVVGTIDVFLHNDGYQVAVRNLHLGCLKYTAEHASELVLELNHAIMQLAHEVAPSAHPPLALSPKLPTPNPDRRLGSHARHPSQVLWSSPEAPRTPQMIEAAVLAFRCRYRREIAPISFRLASGWAQREDTEAVAEDIAAEPELQMAVAHPLPDDGGSFLASTPSYAIMVLKLAVQVLLEAPGRAIEEGEIRRRMETWTAGSRNTLLWKVRQPVETRLLEPASGPARA
jgi:hypothetical protein